MYNRSLIKKVSTFNLILVLVMTLGLAGLLTARGNLTNGNPWGKANAWWNVKAVAEPMITPTLPLPSSDTVILDWDHQDFQGATDPIPVPSSGDYTGVRVWFDSVGTVHPDRADLQLCLRKDTASSPPTDDSYFRHAGWISFTQSVEGEMVYWCAPEAPSGTGTSYEFSVDFSGNNTPAGNCDLGPTGDYCREDFGIVYDDGGTYRWVRSNNGRELPGDRIDANVWWYLEVTDTLIDETLLDIFATYKVSALAIDQDDYWLGTRNGILIHYQADTETVTIYGVGSAHLLGSINDVVLSSSGEVWIATSHGAIKFDGTTWQYFTEADGLLHEHVNAVAISPSDVVWFGTNKGLSKFDGTTWTGYTKQDGLPHNEFTALAVAEDEVLWGVTVNGTFGWFDGDTWETVEGAPRGNIDTMTIIGEAVYLGTNKGLVAYEDGTLTSIEPQVNINEVAGDSEGRVWAISESGELEVPLAVQAASNDSGIKVGIYDPKSGRWLVSLLDQTTHHSIYLPIIFNRFTSRL